MEIIYSLHEISTAANRFMSEIKDHPVIAFHGQMGAGKTSFIKAICEGMGVTEAVSSPTFAIINEYRAGTVPIYHLDLYRLEDEEEAIRAGVEEVLYSGDICFAEWPEKAAGLFPGETLHVTIEILDEERRRLTWLQNLSK